MHGNASDGVLEAQWDALLKHVSEAGTLKNSIVVSDVSGSMTSYLPDICKLLTNLDNEIDYLWGFSTKVEKHTIDDLKANRLKSTGGTSFDCIVCHAAVNNLKNILIITDGHAYLTAYDKNKKLDFIQNAIVLLTGHYPNHSNYFSTIYKQSYLLEEFVQ